MELWVRSQDKELLIKVENLYLDRELGCGAKKCIYTKDIWLAKYKTEKRALEVLNEIQNILQPKVFIKEPKINTDDLIHSMSEYVTLKTTQQVEYDLKQAGQIVYEMPEE